MSNPSPQRLLSRRAPTATALLREALRHRGRAGAYFLLLLVGAALSSSKFILLNQLLQDALAAPSGALGILLPLTVGCWLAGEVVLYAAITLGMTFERLVGTAVVKRTLAALLEQSATSLRPMEANQAFHYLRRGLTTLSRALRGTLSACTQAVLVVFSIATAFWLQPVLAGCCLAAVVAAAARAIRHLDRQRQGTTQAFAGESLFHQRLCRILEGLPQVKLYGAGPAQLERLTIPVRRQKRGEQAALRAQRKVGLEMSLVAAGMGLVLLAAGFWLVQRGLVTVASLGTFLILQQSIFLGVRQVLAQWAGAEEHGDVLAAFLTAGPGPPDEDAGKAKRSLHRPIRRIECRDVVFAVGSTVLLSDVTCRLVRGRLYGVSGPGGSGKTMLLHLLSGAIAPRSGVMLVNGEDSTRLASADLARRIALVTWPPLIEPGTLAANLRLARPEATDDALRAVLEQVAFDADLVRLEAVGGLNAVLGRGGVLLSVGQLQRLALARALLRAPEVLLVDDLLTGLDPISAHRMFAALKAYACDHVVVVILPGGHLVGHCDGLLLTAGGRLVNQTIPGKATRSAGPGHAA